MRLRSKSTEAETLRVNAPTEPSGKPPAGRRLKMKFPKIWAGNKGQKDPKTIQVPGDRQDPAVLEEEPDKGILSFDQNVEQRHFYEAAVQLVQREQLLFGGGSQSEDHREALMLATDHKILETIVLQTIKESLNKGQDAAALASAVNAIQLQEEQDQLTNQSGSSAASWRPSRWRHLHDTMLASLVEERLENPSVSCESPQQQSSIQAGVQRVGLQLKEDLLTVAKAVQTCYPPERNICQLYAELYHKNMSDHLKKIVDFVLDDGDCTFLLRWVTEFYPGLYKSADLASQIDTEALGRLLPVELLGPLEQQYLSRQKVEMMTFITRVLEEAKEMWRNGDEPTLEDGCFVSPVSYDIIQLINGIVRSAEIVVGDREKAQCVASGLSDSLCRFRDFQDDVMKHNKPNSRSFIKANLGCIHQFRDFIQRKSSLFPPDVAEKSLAILADMKQSAHLFLLSPFHKVLKPNYRKLGTCDWLNSSALMATMMDSMENEVQSLEGSLESCHQELMGQLHQEVAVEYVRRLLRGGVKLKSPALQQAAFVRVTSDAESLHSLFSEQGSKEDWLKDVLVMIAGVLGLQDLPAIQMQVVTLGSTYPDLSEKQISALLKLKTNLSKEDRRTVKSTWSDALREISVSPTHAFFSRVFH
ncbi:tumor necrosis factor alpha-induced protein 2 [Synchiropus splendidus]|uniref:tumor necrosis factor alpha-induced protein 2 n=1 Tax=Synchiropus splendidus TaxID=270530 RepID=UPI00237E1EE9|nr:tumor necrosis factor alpha-induced protein 2 [Synchiropus splendidus]